MPGSDSPPTAYFVLTYEKDNLFQFLSKHHQLLKEHELMKIMAGILSALDFIHRAGVIHRDVKPANILINSNLEVILCDFGFARTRISKNLKYKNFEDRQEISKHLRHDRHERRSRPRRLSQHV